jgi:hypothetical protein
MLKSLLVVFWFTLKMKRLFIFFNQSFLNNLEDPFSQYSHTNQKIQTPGAPKTVIMRPEKGDYVLSPKDQTKYHSGVGM